MSPFVTGRKLTRFSLSTLESELPLLYEKASKSVRRSLTTMSSFNVKPDEERYSAHGDSSYAAEAAVLLFRIL